MEKLIQTKNTSNIKNKFFIVKILEYGFLKNIHYLVTSILIFGILPIIIIFYLAFITNRLYIVFRIENWPTFFAISWLSLGPAIIKYVDESILPNFFLNLKKILRVSDSDFNEFYFQFENLFHNKYVYFSSLLSLGTLLMGIASTDYVKYYWNAQSVMEPLSLFILLLLTLTLFLSGIGFCGIYYSIFFIIKKLKEVRFTLDPFSSDGSGGIKFFGEFYIKTTVLFSTGSFVIPAGIQYMMFTRKTISYIGVILLLIFACFVALSFLIPILAIKQIAVFEKEKMQFMIIKEYKELLPAYNKNTQDELDIIRNIASGIKLLVFQQNINRMKAIKVWTIDMEIITQLFSSIAFPLFIGYLQQYINKLTISI